MTASPSQDTHFVLYRDYGGCKNGDFWVRLCWFFFVGLLYLRLKHRLYFLKDGEAKLLFLYAAKPMVILIDCITKAWREDGSGVPAGLQNQ